MKSFALTLLFLLLLPLVNAQQTGPHVLTKYEDVVGNVEIGIMTMAEYNERHKIVRQEQHVFDLALRAATTEWVKNHTISFPRIFSKPDLQRLRVYPREGDALKQMRKLQQAEAERKAIRERNEQNAESKNRGGGRSRGGKNSGNRSSKTDMETLYKRQREARNKAMTIVRDKMDEMMGSLNSAHVGRLKPEDVRSFGQPGSK